MTFAESELENKRYLFKVAGGLNLTIKSENSYCFHDWLCQKITVHCAQW